MVEEIGRRHGVEYPFQGTIATTDGERMWVFRYSSEHNSRSLFYSTDIPTLRSLYPHLETLQRALRQRAADRLRAARRTVGRVERDARVELRGGRARDRRDPAVRGTSTREPRSQLTPNSRFRLRCGYRGEVYGQWLCTGLRLMQRSALAVTRWPRSSDPQHTVVPAGAKRWCSRMCQSDVSGSLASGRDRSGSGEAAPAAFGPSPPRSRSEHEAGGVRETLLREPVIPGRLVIRSPSCRDSILAVLAWANRDCYPSYTKPLHAVPGRAVPQAGNGLQRAEAMASRADASSAARQLSSARAADGRTFG